MNTKLDTYFAKKRFSLSVACLIHLSVHESKHLFFHFDEV